MTDGRTSYTSSNTTRQYDIRRHYTCQSRMVVYLVTCLLCPDKKQYTGKTIRSMAERHRGHRAEIKSASLGEHFHKHLLDMGLDPKANNNIEKIVPYFDLVVIASVNPGSPRAEDRLDRLEADFQHRLMTMNTHGGLNLRCEVKRHSKK